MLKVIHLFIVIINILKINILNGLPSYQEYGNKMSHLLSGYSNRCYEIPKNMSLCYNIGYKEMVLPNFLQHDTVREVSEKSVVWLRRLTCHHDVTRFLCALYAPVCIKTKKIKKVPPCRELCLTVKNACVKQLLTFGYNWPIAFQCDNYPPYIINNVCVNGSKVNGICAKKACTTSYDPKHIQDFMCRATTVLKAYIRGFSLNKTTIKLKKKSVILKTSNLDFPVLKSNLVFKCLNCNSFNYGDLKLNKKKRYLLMGKSELNRMGVNEFHVYALIKWKRTKKFRKRVRRYLRKTRRVCPEIARKTDKRYTKRNIAGKERHRGKKRNRNNP